MSKNKRFIGFIKICSILSALIMPAMVYAVNPTINFMGIKATPEECLPVLPNVSIEYHYMISYTGTMKSPYKTDVPLSCCKSFQYGCFRGANKGYVVQGCAECRPSYTVQDSLLNVASGESATYNNCVPPCSSKNYCDSGFYGCSTNGSTGCKDCPNNWDVSGPYTQLSDYGCNFVETDCYLTGDTSYEEYPGQRMDEDETGFFQLFDNCYYEK